MAVSGVVTVLETRLDGIAVDVGRDGEQDDEPDERSKRRHGFGGVVEPRCCVRLCMETTDCFTLW